MNSADPQKQIEALKEQLDRWNFTPYSGSHVTPEQIAAEELRLGRQLPADYRWLCLTHGSGYSKGSALTIDSGNHGPVAFTRIGSTREIQHPDAGYNPPHAPPGLVKCAYTDTGDPFFLRLDPEHRGGVWFFDYREGEDLFTGLVKVADSFTDLLARALHVIARTDRLTLRVFEHDDSTALFNIRGSAKTMELMPLGLLENEVAARALIDERRLEEREFSCSTWAVVLLSSGRLIGSCGIRRREPGGPFELGYVIDHRHWGQGYATEAATAAIDRVFSYLVVSGTKATIFATIRPNNAPSIEVAQRLGMRQAETVADEHGELLKFELQNQ